MPQTIPYLPWSDAGRHGLVHVAGDLDPRRRLNRQHCEGPFGNDGVLDCGL